MAHKISLYIADKQVDLADDNLVLLNYTFEDLTNPTIVKNSYSKSITLKGTPTNNAIFGNLWKLDRVTASGNPFDGIYFDATIKTPFTIYNEMSEVLVNGYCKMDSIKKVGSDVDYTISLYGGLGSFFYALTYNPDGTKMTLADLTYEGVREPLQDFTIINDRRSVVNAWDDLCEEGGADSYNWVEVLNFAPCYNGKPDDFDTKKIVYNGNAYRNIPLLQRDEAGDVYSKQVGRSSILAELTNEHNEWEMKDLRWYLQRPILRVFAILKGICSKSYGGYTLQYSTSFRETGLWMTLPMIRKEDRNSVDCINNLMAKTISPAEFLIGFAKMYGLIFVVDEVKKEVLMTDRYKFFLGGKKIDISDKIDRASMQIHPNVANHKFYQLGGAKPIQGAFAEDYARSFGQEYGIQRINTNYGFDNETEVLTKTIPFKEAANVQESSVLFSYDAYSVGEMGGIEFEETTIPLYEQMFAQLWRGDQMKKFPIAAPVNGEGFPFENDYKDWFSKMQFHSIDGKSTDGSYVILSYNWYLPVPIKEVEGGNFIEAKLRVSDDTSDMLVLNGGKPCWNWCSVGDSVTMISNIPVFNNFIADEQHTTIEKLLSYGQPLAIGYSDFAVTDAPSLYDIHWKKYLTDRYDKDTKVVRCKVDLRGMQVGQSMLGNFYWFDNCYWVLNKIENHSLTTDDLTECEFIKVKDINNYIA